MLKNWYILQFKPNSHHQAIRNLNRQGFETFLPTHNNTTRKASRFVNTPQPLFPGYMFVTFDKTGIEWHKINNTYGVSRLVTFNTTLKSVPSEFIDNLMKRCNLSEELLPIKIYKQGDQIKVQKGPFANFIATIEKYETYQRIWILMDLMGREAKIQISSNAIQPSY